MIWRGGFFFFSEGSTVFSLNTLGLSEKFPHELNIWKVSSLVVDKRQSYAASWGNADDTLRSILVFVRCTESFSENSPSPLPYTHVYMSSSLTQIFHI